MSKIIEPPLEKNEIQLTSKHRLSIDKYNKTLSFRYAKREGKGRNAEYSGEYGYNNEKYYSTFEYMIDKLFNYESDESIMKDINEAEEKDIKALIKAVENTKLYMTILKEEIVKALHEKIIINVEAKKKVKNVVKGQVIDEDDSDDE